ncbi:MAG: sel1 repeat family protein [Alphaproteobacteria bacterium]|nr:sel1 repeat family protein [Alphaproteobacteria bacterium]
MNNLGTMYFYGNFVQQNFIKSVRLFSLSARCGNCDAICNLATAYKYGIGVDLNVDKAVELYARIAKQGDKCAKESIEKLAINGNSYAESVINEFN